MKLRITLLTLLFSVFIRNDIHAYDSLLPQVTHQEAKTILTRSKTITNDRERAGQYLDLAYYYLYTEGSVTENLGKAAIYIQMAEVLTNKISQVKVAVRAAILHSILLKENKKDNEAEIMLKKAIVDAHQSGYKDLEVWALYQKSLLSKSLDEQLSVLTSTEQLLKGTPFQLELASIYRKKGTYYYDKSQYKDALREFTAAMKIFKSIGHKKMGRIYRNMALTHASLGQNLESVEYGFKALDYEAQDLKIESAISYSIIGISYRFLGKKKEGLKFMYKSLQIFDNEKEAKWALYVAGHISTTYSLMNRDKEALELYLKYHLKYPPLGERDKWQGALRLTQLYTNADRFVQADSSSRIILSMMAAPQSKFRVSNAYFILGDFYYQFKNFEQARHYYNLGKISSPGSSKVFKKLSVMDSIDGNFKAALENYKRYKVITDSLRDEDRTKLIESLRVTYQVKENKANLAIKEAQLELRNRELQVLGKNALLLKQNAILLNREARLRQSKLDQASLSSQKAKAEVVLKDKNIQLLNRQSALNRSEIRQQGLIKNIITVLVLMFALVIALLWRQYLSKQKTNKLITQKNQLLQDLLSDKSWLLKEMHHRVKNNLHTVISLLESQSAYLKTDALYAIKNSQHRIYAMSLIHQKLYQSDDVKTIDMAVYIPDLIIYLKESLEIRNNIKIVTDIDPIDFEIAEAVPLGLIINEAVTNSLKYAFLGRDKGQVNITLKKQDNRRYQLVIEDDGIGLPVDFELKKVLSMGMKLIKGLTEQLEGILEIEGKNGTRISITSIVSTVLANTTGDKKIEEVI
jgi:two-component system, sensor histidine kinase PdtaS